MENNNPNPETCRRNFKVENLDSNSRRALSSSMTDQAELDKQYSPSQWCTRISPDQVVQAHVDKLERGTRACQDHWPADQLELNVPYGGAPSSLASSKNMLLDIYHPHPDKDTHHVVFYIHGGYWVALHKDQSGWFAYVRMRVPAIVYSLMLR